MEKARVVLTQVLDKQKLDQAIQQQANTVICREVDLDKDLPENIKMINAESPNRFAKRHIFNEFTYRSASKLVAAEYAE